MPLTAVRIVHESYIIRHIDGALRKSGPHVRYSECRPRYSTAEPGGRRRSRGGSHRRSLTCRWDAVNVLERGGVRILRPFDVRVSVKLAKNDEGQ